MSDPLPYPEGSFSQNVSRVCRSLGVHAPRVNPFVITNKLSQVVSAMNRGGMAFTMKSVGIVLVLLAACALSCVFAARELDEVDSKSNTLHVPDAIRVPSGYKLHLILCAEGDQYYQYNGTSWVDYAAKAKLLNREKKVIGRHFYLSHPDHLGGQPSWETLPSKGVPESLVTGVVVETTTVDENSIQWVLLKATNNSGDK